jgi:hypothetical protein
LGRKELLMTEAALTFGVVIFLGIFFVMLKLPLRQLRWLLGHHIMLDISVTVFALAIHWGTMTGLMAAAIAGMITSIMTVLGRWAVGYREGEVTVRGVLM